MNEYTQHVLTAKSSCSMHRCLLIHPSECMIVSTLVSFARSLYKHIRQPDVNNVMTRNVCFFFDCSIGECALIQKVAKVITKVHVYD